MKPGEVPSVRGVTLVLGTSAGGTGAHVRMLAAGLSRRGIAVTVAGPPSVDARFSFSAVPAVCFSPASISSRGRAGDLAGILRLRKLLLRAGKNAGYGASRADGGDASPGDASVGGRPVGGGPVGGASVGGVSVGGGPAGGGPRGDSGAGHVVHAHGLRAGAFVVLALLSVRGRRPPVVVTAHNAPPSGWGAGRLTYRLLELVVARGADLVLCVSPDLEARMRAAGARRVGRAVIAAADAPGPVVASPPGAPVPEGPVLGGSVPGGSVPGGSVPEGPVPGGPVPDRPVPGGPVRGGPVPDGPVPDGPVPGGPVPDGPVPDGPVPGRSVSDGPVPGRSVPGGPTAGGPVPGEVGAGGRAGRPVVLAVGRLAAQKGLDVLLEAAAGWRDLEPMPLVVIVGDGPLAPRLRARAVQLNVPAVFLGRRDDVPARLAATAVFVLPSRWEGQPLVLQEALRAGAPIVATRVGGIPGLTGEDAALLVPPGDARALRGAVRSVLTDPDLAGRLAAAARARAAALPTEEDAVAAALAAYGAVVG